MHLSSPTRSSPKAMLPLSERYKNANTYLHDEIRRIKVVHAQQLAEKDAMIEDLNEQIQRLQQQQAQLTRTMSKSSSSSISTNPRSGTPRRPNSQSASSNSSSSLRMAELTSISSTATADEDESITSNNLIHESFLSIPTVPLPEGDEEEEEEKVKKVHSSVSQNGKEDEETIGIDNVNSQEEEDEEVVSDKLPRRKHSLSTFVRTTSKRFVRRMSFKKAQKPFSRRKLGRKGTPLPSSMAMVGDLKERDIVEEEEEETDPREIHFQPATQYEDENSQNEPPRLESLRRIPSMYSTSSSVWSTDPIPSDSALQLESKKQSVWPKNPLPAGSANGSTRPRRATIAATTVRVRELPRELSLNRVVTDEESDDEDDEDLRNPHLPTKQNERHLAVSTVQVQCRHIIDACNRRGMYSGSLDLQTQLPHGQGRMIYPDRAQYLGSWEAGHWHGKATLRDGKGSVYHGYFEQDKKEGTGILKYANGKTFEGRFKKDQMYEGTMMDARTGSTHEGLFENGLSHGFGSHRYSDGAEYRGQFEQGERHGHGTAILTCGAHYTGDFENDVAHGIGQSVNGDGTVEYTGHWEAGQPAHPPIYDA